jgi:NitT/TauT family transport system substrate-binding protein
MKQLGFVVMLAFLVGCLSGCEDSSSQQTADGKRKVKLQLYWKPEPQFGGFYEAQRIGAFARRGLEVEIIPGGAGEPSEAIVGAGRAEFGLSSADQVLISRARGNNLVAVFTTYQTNPQAIMAPAARGLTKLDDVFTGGTLAIEQGKPFSLFLEKKFGFEKLQVVPSPFGDLSEFRTRNDYAMQCFITSEPLMARRAGLDPKVFLISDSGFNPYVGLVVATESFVQQNRKIVDDFVAALEEGWTSYLADPTPANEMMRQLNPTMDEQTFRESAEAQKPLVLGTPAVPIGAMSKQRWDTLASQLVDLNLIPSVGDVDKCYIPRR